MTDLFTAAENRRNGVLFDPEIVRPFNRQEDPMTEIATFDKDAWCVVHTRPNSDVVQVTSNLADKVNAERYADTIRQKGGYVFHVVQVNVLVAALYLARGNAATGAVAAAQKLLDAAKLARRAMAAKYNARECAALDEAIKEAETLL